MDNFENEGTNRQSLSEEKLVQHIFVVSLEQIKLNSNKSVEVVIRYNYSLFQENEVTTAPSIVIDPGSESIEIPPEQGFIKFKLKPTTKPSHVRIFLKSNPLVLQVFDQDNLLGKVTVNLGIIYDNESQKLSQQSFKKFFPVMFENESIGCIEGLFVLETEDLTRCKSCEEIFRTSTILKHVNHRANTDCRKNYNEKETKFLMDQSSKCKKQRRVVYDTKNYDPSKRSEKHKKTYNSDKRVAAFQNKKAQRRQELQLEKQEAFNEVQKENNKSLEVAARYENSFLRDSEKGVVKMYLKRYSLSLSDEGKRKIAKIEATIDDEYNVFESEINDLVKKASNLKVLDHDSHRAVYCNLFLRFPKEHSGDRLVHDWRKLSDENNIELENISKEMGVSTPKKFRLPNFKPEECKICLENV